MSWISSHVDDCIYAFEVNGPWFVIDSKIRWNNGGISSRINIDENKIISSFRLQMIADFATTISSGTSYQDLFTIRHVLSRWSSALFRHIAGGRRLCWQADLRRKLRHTLDTKIEMKYGTGPQAFLVSVHAPSRGYVDIGIVLSTEGDAGNLLDWKPDA